MDNEAIIRNLYAVAEKRLRASLPAVPSLAELDPWAHHHDVVVRTR